VLEEPRGDKPKKRPAISLVTPEEARGNQPAVVEAIPSSAPSLGPEPSRGTPRRRQRQVLIAAVLLLVMVSSQGLLAWQAEGIRKSLLANPSSYVEKTWYRYRILHWLDFFGILRRTAGEEMKIALSGAAQRIWSRYAEGERVRRKEWVSALGYITAALELDGNDRGNRARSIYCRGHIALADAKSFRSKKNVQGAHAKRVEAVADFLEAARQDQKWPDPHLGLARVYTYEKELFDLAKVDSEVAETQRLGFHDGRRLIAFRADGRRQLGQNLLEQARGTLDTERKKELLKHAIEQLDSATALYKQIPGYASVEPDIKLTLKVRKAAERNLASLDSALPPPTQ